MPTEYDKKLAADEARRVSQYETVKEDVRGKVQRDIQQRTETNGSEERAAGALAESLKRKAVREVATTDSEIERAKNVARASQVIDYLFYLIYGVIGIEIALELLGAREGAPFKRFVDALAAPFLTPFRGLMPEPGVGAYRLALSAVIALVVYVLLHVAVNGFLRIFVHRKTAV
jgi:uncharacterized protein YggT (Ycf19 family)